MEYLILFLPLVGSIVSGFFGKLIGDKICQILTSFFVSISSILSLIVFFKVINYCYVNNIPVLVNTAASQKLSVVQESLWAAGTIATCCCGF